MRWYRVWHRTAYTYSKPVQDSVGQFHLVARDLPWQRVSASAVEARPRSRRHRAGRRRVRQRGDVLPPDRPARRADDHRDERGHGRGPGLRCRRAGTAVGGGRPADPAPRDAGGVAGGRVRAGVAPRAARAGGGGVRRRLAHPGPADPRGGDRPHAADLPRLRLRQDRHDRDKLGRRRHGRPRLRLPGLRPCGPRVPAVARDRCPLRLGLPRDAAAAGQGARVRRGRLPRVARGVGCPVPTSGSRSTPPTTSGPTTATSRWRGAVTTATCRRSRGSSSRRRSARRCGYFVDVAPRDDA